MKFISLVWMFTCDLSHLGHSARSVEGNGRGVKGNQRNGSPEEHVSSSLTVMGAGSGQHTKTWSRCLKLNCSRNPERMCWNIRCQWCWLNHDNSRSETWRRRNLRWGYLQVLQVNSESTPRNIETGLELHWF